MQRYIILRRAEPKPEKRRMAIFRPKAAQNAVSEARVEVADLSSRDIGSLPRDPTVVATAPAFPMRLHKPLVRGGAGIGGAMSWGVPAVLADKAPFDGKGIAIGILDSGIDLNHPAFNAVRARIVTRDFTGEGNADIDGHGTHCAGTIFGGDVGGTRIGIARNIGRGAVAKVLGNNGGSSEQVIRGVEWAIDQGANIVSMSLGLDFPGQVERNINAGQPADLATSHALDGYRRSIDLFTALVTYLTQRANANGRFLLVVAAAGNESRLDIDADYAIRVSPPAAAPGILSVAALEKRADALYVAPYSNTGARVAAPGSDIISAAAGTQGLIAMSGTSMAAPPCCGCRRAVGAAACSRAWTM